MPVGCWRRLWQHNDLEAAQPVLDWLERSGLEDVRLAELAQQLGAGRL